MNEAELRKHSTCSLCRQPIGRSGLPLFWTVRIERYGIDLTAVRRQDGFAAFLGSPALAAVMGPDEQMAQKLMDPVNLTVCETCSTRSQHCVAALAEAS